VSDSPDVDQQLVIHLFTPTDGPLAEPGYAALRELWLGCRQFFLMRDPLPYGDLPHQLPDSHRVLASRDDEVVLAAQQRQDADCQAILRRHRDVLNLSVVLAAPPGARASAGHSWWQDLDAQWSALSGRLTGDLLGEARIYLAGHGGPPDQYLDDLLPAPARIGRWRPTRAVAAGPLGLWEALPWADDRALRRLVLTRPADEESHDAASSWAWSDGSTAIPPLARYLLHAAKLRYLYRVWRRDSTTREFTAAVRSQAAAALPTTTGTADTAGTPDAMPGAGDGDGTAAGLRDQATRARLMAADLRELRQAVEIAEHNMGRAVGGLPLSPAGPFADDLGLAGNFLARLDDEVRYLEIAAERATEVTGLLTARAAAGAATGAAAGAAARAGESAPAHGARARRAAAADITRNVFVVHGRDEQARGALFRLLESLGLHPLDWESLVAATGSASPYLREVIMQGIAMAQAAVVLMTPDDMVLLHPDLRDPDDDEGDITQAMQARPNVILELGMALATYADRTIVLYAGRHRPMADLSGLNYVQLSNRSACLDKVISRLRTAGCQLSGGEPDARTRDQFRDLASYTRRPR
jgi:predicted nucleotide-binding protein